MKGKHIFTVLFAFQLSLFAQLKVKYLPFNDLQYLDYLNQKNNPQKNARTESLADTVRPTITIKITKGNNPRCINTGDNFTFTATGHNWGQSGTVEWFVNNISTSVVATSFAGSNFANSTTISGRVTSTLPCAKPLIIESNKIIIEESGSLEASVSLKVIAGNNPECNGNISNITLQAIPTYGGADPQFSWLVNNTIVSSIVGNNYSYSNSDAIRVRMVSNLGSCVSSLTSSITSSQFIRTYSSSIIQQNLNAVELRLISLTNDFCGQSVYNFEATAYNAGSNPIYNWYRNDFLIFTSSSSKTFSTPLASSGDEIVVKVKSSLNCVNITTSSSNVFAKVDTLISLPFFEDFSSYSGSPDNNKWMKNGGTLVTNTYSDSPPTLGLAIFDGLKYTGSPYDSLNLTNRGLSDNLTSLPYDFSYYNNRDSLYLHFFWMYGGLGDAPELNQADKISLLFKDQTGNFNEVWAAVPGPSSLSGQFFHASVAINDTNSLNYLFRGFQFKFQTTGRLSGQYDVWGIDYVVLSRKSKPELPNYIDQSFSKQPLPFLKNYASMPYKHFISDKNNQLTTVGTSLNNISIRDRNNHNVIGRMIESFSGNNLGELLNLSISLEANTRNFEVIIPVNAILFPAVAPRNPYELKSILTIDANNNNTITGMPYAINNTITAITRFDNYYAYDDGSAEYVVSNNAKNENVAVKFMLPPTVTDTLKQIAIQLNKTNKQLLGQSFRIVVWKSRPKNAYNFTTKEVLYNKIVQIKYAPKINGYTVFNLDKSIVLADSFFVGYSQISDGELIVGFDKNTNSTENIWYSSGGAWYNYSLENPESKGSIMIRPVFGIYSFEVTKSKETAPPFIGEISVYPNPTDGNFCVSHPFESIEVYDLIGNKVGHFKATESSCIENHGLQNGIYFLKIRMTNSLILTKKLIITNL